MLSFLQRGVLDEIMNLIESVAEGFPSYSRVNITNNISIQSKQSHPQNRSTKASTLTISNYMNINKHLHLRIFYVYARESFNITKTYQ